MENVDLNRILDIQVPDWLEEFYFPGYGDL